jgi:hypothetical protein
MMRFVLQIIKNPIWVRTQKTDSRTARQNRRDFRSLLNRVYFHPGRAKVTVVLLFTICWLSIVLARNHVSDPTTLESSLLTGLAASLQQGAMSGRDFQSSYGPAAQFLAQKATTATATGSALDAYGMIVFFFCGSTAFVVAAILLLCDRISWQQSAIFYAFSFLLNLFFQVFDIRTALLLLNAVLAYRTIAAETFTRRTLWATATGLLCFISQLVSFELGIYASVVIVCALIAGFLLTRNTEILLGIEIFIATLAVANLDLAVYFKLTSSSYTLFFDYQNYALEILRGYHNSMGMVWALPAAHTIVLVIVTLYVIGVCVVMARTSDPLDASLYASLAFAAVLWLKTALVRSDVAQITFAFTPVAVIIGLLATKEWASLKRRVAWTIAAASLVLVWPSFNGNAPVDLFKIARGQTSVRAALRDLRSAKRPLEESLQASLVTPDLEDRSKIPLLAFPYDNYIPAGLRRPIFAPLLESYAVATPVLEQRYVQALEKKQRAGLEIVYGPDKEDALLDGSVQAITRTPIIFEHIYRHFEIVGIKEHDNGQYILRTARVPRDVNVEPLGYQISQQWVDAGTLKLTDPSVCGLVRVEIQINYEKNPVIFKPSDVEVIISNGDHIVWQGAIKPLEPNQTFVTYVSPLPSATFHKVFGQDRIQGVKWDKLQYRSLPAGMLGSKASRVQIRSLRCVDPQKFVEGTPELNSPA